MGFPGGSVVKHPSASAGDRFDPWIRKIPWQRKRHPTSVFLPGKSTGGGGWQATAHEDTKESDMTEHTQHTT